VFYSLVSATGDDGKSVGRKKIMLLISTCFAGEQCLVGFKYLFSSQPQRNKIFSLTLASGFRFFFSPVHTNPFSFVNAYFKIRFRLSSTLKRVKTLIETRVYDTFFGTVFKSLRFLLCTLEERVFKIICFQKASGLKPFWKACVFISVFIRKQISFVGA